MNLLTDVFVDGYHLDGWKFSIAPCWFPDLVLVGLVYAATGNVVTATIVGGFAHFIVLILGISFCWRAMRINRPVVADVLTLLTGVAITLHVAVRPENHYGAFQQFFLPQTHIGNLINMVWALGLAMFLVNDRIRMDEGFRPKLLLAAYATICLLGAMSDILFVPHFLAPLTIAIALLLLVRRISAQRIWFVLAGWPAAFLGYWANRIVFSVTDISSQSELGWKVFQAALKSFSQGVTENLAAADFLHVLALLWLVGSAAIAARLLLQSKRIFKLDDTMKAVFFVVVAAAGVCSTAAVIGGGSGTLTAYGSYGLTTRYLHPLLFLPLLGWPVLLEGFWGKAWGKITDRVLLSGAVAGLFVAGVFVARTGIPERPLHRYAPLLVRELDTYARQYGIQYGVAGYWHARLTTLLSQTGLRVYSVDRNLQPHHWVSNIEWYSQSLEDRNQTPPISFAILGEGPETPHEGDVSAVLGDGYASLHANQTPVSIYPHLTHQHRAKGCLVPPGAAAGANGVEFKGQCLSGSTGHAEDGRWVAHASSDKAGFATLGNTPRFQSGAYLLEIDYTALSEDGSNNAAVTIGYPNRQLLYSASLDVGKSRLSAPFVVPDDMGGQNLSIRVFFTGSGTVDIHRLVLRPQRSGK